MLFIKFGAIYVHMHIIEPYNAYAKSSVNKTWQEQIHEQQVIAELEAKELAEKARLEKERLAEQAAFERANGVRPGERR